MNNDDFQPAEIKPTIGIDALEKVDVRVGTIVEVSEIADSRSLMKLHVDFGDHRRQILAGIKQERDKPQELVGVQALFIVNLKPRTMMGHLSEGMLFDIGYDDGVTPVLAQPEHPVPNGARAG